MYFLIIHIKFLMLNIFYVIIIKYPIRFILPLINLELLIDSFFFLVIFLICFLINIIVELKFLLVIWHLSITIYYLYC